LEFKETLSVLLISGLFILLASRIELSAMLNLGWGSIVVLLVIMFVARPISVFISSLGTNLNWREIALLSWIAPRGIVAAAVSALFALKLEALNYDQVELLVPMVFLVIIATVVIQSLTSVKVAKMLEQRAPAPYGFLIFGGGLFSRLFAKELMVQDVTVRVADTNWESIRLARMDNIPTYYGNPMSEHAGRTVDLSLYGTVLVISPYKQLNPLVTYHFEHELGKGAVLGLTVNEPQKRASHQVSESYAAKLCLFNEDVTYAKLAGYVNKGSTIKTTRLSDAFSYEDYEIEYKKRSIRLCAIEPNGKVKMFTSLKNIHPKSDWRIVSLITEEKSVEVS
jgi:hypothetical protein